MTPTVRLATSGDAAADRRIDAFLDACPTSVAQQTTAWRDVIVATDADQPRFLVCHAGDDVVGVLPAYRFDGPLGAILTSVPQAGPLGGIAAAPGADLDAVYRALLDAFVALARREGCALASLITNPVWPDRERYETVRAPDYVLENSCLVLDLGTALAAPEALVRGGSNLARNLRKATGGGLRIDEEQSAANVRRWYAIHAERHRELGAPPLPEALFTAALAHAVPRGKATFFFVRDATDVMVGGGFYVHHGGVIDAFMPAMTRDAAALGPNYLLAWHSMRWAAGRGIRYYNWQASPPDGGVHRFKAQWGSVERPYAYLTWVTGDAAPFLRSTVEDVRRGYAWHYVLPFDRIGTGRDASGPSTRRAAWAAGRGDPR